MNPEGTRAVCYNERWSGNDTVRSAMHMRTQAVIWLALAVAALGMSVAAPAGPKAVVEVKATLKGEVLAEGLARVGDEVAEGDPLVFVKTQTGRAVAARATVDGRVAEMLVRPGTVIRELGTVVARLDPK